MGTDKPPPPPGQSYRPTFEQTCIFHTARVVYSLLKNYRVSLQCFLLDKILFRFKRQSPLNRSLLQTVCSSSDGKIIKYEIPQRMSSPRIEVKHLAGAANENVLFFIEPLIACCDFYSYNISINGQDTQYVGLCLMFIYAQLK